MNRIKKALKSIPAVNMIFSVQKMLFSCVVCGMVLLTAAQNEYLPPSKGYLYPTPSKPFTPVKPTPPPIRTTTPRNGYLPPVTQPSPTPPRPTHEVSAFNEIPSV
ncbi:hypothetical protein KGM_205130 [Danaus plexippus plexippus]|uniref:Uncharacterized protein n=1 Tax=Danaus plexippus plexippus TaxID=278856 RepID=A0A212EMS8_DANPL|nr:hypothetical protein KGM_205130 [Danaus plexippus plexippus]